MNSDTCPPACPSSRDPPRPSRDQLRPSRSLAGKVAIVTGAGSRGDDEVGNGRAISLLLAEDGASVVCVDRELRLAERTAAMIEHEAGSGRAVAWRADVSREGECAGTVEAALRAFGRVDVLVNNVGVLGPTGTATEAEVEAWARGLEVNVTSMMLMVKHAVPAMAGNEAEAGIRGAIVNMGSVAGLRGGTPSLLYPTSKGAVVNMTRAMAAHHGGQGIRVNCVCPGTSVRCACVCPARLRLYRHVCAGACLRLCRCQSRRVCSSRREADDANRHAVHAHGLRILGAGHGGRDARGPPPRQPAADRGQRLGLCRRGAFPGGRRGAMDHGHRADRRRGGIVRRRHCRAGWMSSC